MDAGKRSINDIFNGNRVLEIPFFQRAYVWGESQWERWLEDMEQISQSEKMYFLGSVILKQQPTNSNNAVGDKRTLIDGQQRLTTLNIFFKVLFLKMNINSRFDRLFRLADNDELALWHNYNDRDSFEEILNLETLADVKGDNNIVKAYNYFKNNIIIEKFNPKNILSRVQFVGIDLNENDDEQQIFDTINSLGVRLTTAELLKNYFFSRDDIAMYEKYWKNLFEIDEETKKYWDTEVTTGRMKRTFIDLFFDAFLQIKIQDKNLNVRTEDKLAYAKVEDLFESYKGFIRDYLQGEKSCLLDEIKPYAEIFATHFSLSDAYQELPAQSGMERINTLIFSLENSTLIPYVLYILKNVQNETTRDELLGFIESYIMRRMVVNANNKNYNQLFANRLINQEILNKQQFINYLAGQDDKVNFLPTDEELKHGFHSSQLINKQSAGILYFIESKIRNRSLHSTQLLGIDKYSLEHIMPKKWENNWDKVDSEEAKFKRNRKLMTLGNLAIISQSLNSSIRDADWQTKRDGKKDKNNGLRMYASSFDTMSNFINRDNWDESVIDERAEYLYEHAKNIWHIK